MNLNEQTEQLLETSCWVIDPLPCQVPADGEGQFFAAEQYWLAPPRMAELRAHFFQILLKLNCYYDLYVSSPSEDTMVRNPDPASFASRMLLDSSEFNILIPSQDSLITLRSGDLNLTVYHPSEQMLPLLTRLAAAEGLFFWNPESGDRFLK